MTDCRFCSTPVLLVRMEATRETIPVDPTPDPGGRIAARLVKPARYGLHPYLSGRTDLPQGYTAYRRHHCGPPPANPALFDTPTLEGNQ